MSVNKMIVIGNLVTEPTLENIPDKPILNGRIATNERWTDDEQKKHEETEFHNFSAFGRNAQIISEYLEKGSLVYLEGKSKTTSWKDGDQNTHYRTFLSVTKVELLGK